MCGSTLSQTCVLQRACACVASLSRLPKTTVEPSVELRHLLEPVSDHGDVRSRNLGRLGHVRGRDILSLDVIRAGDFGSLGGHRRGLLQDGDDGGVLEGGLVGGLHLLEELRVVDLGARVGDGLGDGGGDLGGEGDGLGLEVREEGFDLLEVLLALREELLHLDRVRGERRLGHGDWRRRGDLAGPDVDSLGDDDVDLAVHGGHVLRVLLLDLGHHGHAVRLDEVLDLGDGALERVRLLGVGVVAARLGEVGGPGEVLVRRDGGGLDEGEPLEIGGGSDGGHLLVLLGAYHVSATKSGWGVPRNGLLQHDFLAQEKCAK
mmetsp:Transcript_4242/g.17426  ORF Transcript_4242/g.17426 Transcript_4242/m.17426 type:complete len:319 (+) Transcript_4242:944-1900(+)